MKQNHKSIARRATKDIHKGYDIQARIEMAIEAALAKQEQGDPVGEVESSLRFTGGFHVKLRHTATMPEVGTKLYTTPQQRKPLNYAQRFEIITRWKDLYADQINAAEMLIAMTEAAHGIAPQVAQKLPDAVEHYGGVFTDEQLGIAPQAKSLSIEQKQNLDGIIGNLKRHRAKFDSLTKEEQNSITGGKHVWFSKPVDVHPTKDVEISNMGKPFTVKAYVTPLVKPAAPQGSDK